MALFEFDDGQLIPAQFGRTVADGITPEILDAVRFQVLEIVSRPLFPITWRDLSRLSSTDQSADEEPRLTALDSSGQVVSVEVVQHLDSETLMAALSRLAQTATLSWLDLAREYPGNVEGFRADWAHFRDSMPPSHVASPRLVIVAASIEGQVRPALDVLAASGIEVHEMTLKQMSNGRAFLEVHTVGPRLFGHVPQVLLGSTSELARLASPETEAELPAGEAPEPIPETGVGNSDGALSAGEALEQAQGPVGETLAAGASQMADDGTGTEMLDRAGAQRNQVGAGMNGALAAGASQAAVSADRLADHPLTRTGKHQAVELLPVRNVDGSVAVTSARGHGRHQGAGPAGQDSVDAANQAADAAVASGRDQQPVDRELAKALNVPLLERDGQGLRALGAFIGQSAALAVRPSLDPTLMGQLAESGQISVQGQEFSDPTQALAACGLADVDGWAEWHLGDQMGPTLAESLDELNREMLREYQRIGAPAPSSHRH